MSRPGSCGPWCLCACPRPGLPAGTSLTLCVRLSVFSPHSYHAAHGKKNIVCLPLVLITRSPSHLTTPLPRGALGAPPNALTPWGLCAAGEPCGAAAAPSPEEGGPWCGTRGGRKALTLIHSWLEKRQHGVQSRNNIYPSTALNLFVSHGAQIFTLSVKDTCTFSSGKYFYV